MWRRASRPGRGRRPSPRHEHRVVEPPGRSEVIEQVHDGEEVPKEPVEQGQPEDRLEVVSAEELYGGPQ